MCEHSHSVGLFELADLLDLVHEISSIDILHDEVQPVLEAVNERKPDKTIGLTTLNQFYATYVQLGEVKWFRDDFQEIIF